MNDSTIRLSADTSALTESLSKIAEEMTAMKDAVSSSATAMGANFDASTKQAEATNAAIHGLDDSIKTVTDSIQAQTKTVTDLGSEQSKVTKEISKALNTQNSQQKDANTTLAEQKKIMQEQETEIKKVTKAVDSQTGVLQKNAGGWKMLMTGFAVPVVRDNTLSFRRLHAGATPVQIFTKSNMPSSPVITYSLPKDDDVDEVVVNFTSPKTYKTETVYCHVDADGNKRITSYPESDNQEQLDAWGVTDYDHAVALGMRRLRYLRNTRVTYEIKTELNGLNCQFNDLVGLMLDENLSNITGRITGINGQTITTDIELPEDVWEGIVYISRKDGSYGEYTFYRNDSHSLYLDTYPDIDWDSEFGKSLEYPLFAIGELQLCWVTAVKPESNNRCSLSLINYSEDIFKDDIKEKNQ